MIFEDINRFIVDVADYSEPIFRYLNRSARKSAAKVRGLMEDWFSHLPTEEKVELLPRLRSSQNQELISAFFELYNHELLLRLGYELQFHPIIDKKSPKKPDFLVIGNSEKFVLEAVTTHELSENERRGEIFLDQAFDKFNEIQSKDFFIHIVVRGNLVSQFPTRKTKEEILNWLSSLNYDDVKEKYQLQDRNIKIPKKEFHFDGATLIVSPIPKSHHSGIPERLIGSSTTGFRAINTKEAIRRAIEKKSGRYGALEIPYIVAINVLSMSCDTDDVIDALFGSEQYIISSADHSSLPVPSRAKDGVWSRYKRTRMSGVLVIKNLTPWTVAQEDVTLFLNPWAKHLYKGRLLDLPYHEVNEAGVICRYSGITPRKIFNLPSNWLVDKQV